MLKDHENKMLEPKKLTKSELGKLGAQALNSDKRKKAMASKKAAQTRKARNPDAFKEMGFKSAKNRYQNLNTNKE
jgi:hypothetical protein